MRNRKNHVILILSLIILVAVAVLLYALYLLFGNVNSSQLQNETITEPRATQQPVGQIAIPGYESLTLLANEKKQNISLHNPAQNQCYFRISIVLEDNTVVWKSDLIEPGDSSQIILSKKYEPNVYYNSALKYECFSLDESRTPLNGAETVLTLVFK